MVNILQATSARRTDGCCQQSRRSRRNGLEASHVELRTRKTTSFYFPVVPGSRCAMSWTGGDSAYICGGASHCRHAPHTPVSGMQTMLPTTTPLETTLRHPNRPPSTAEDSNAVSSTPQDPRDVELRSAESDGIGSSNSQWNVALWWWERPSSLSSACSSQALAYDFRLIVENRRPILPWGPSRNAQDARASWCSYRRAGFET